jgi:hypothetical protein
VLNKLPILLCCLSLSVNTAALVVALSAPTLSQSCYKVKGKSKVVLVHAIKVYGTLLEVLLPLLVTDARWTSAVSFMHCFTHGETTSSTHEVGGWKLCRKYKS